MTNKLFLSEIISEFRSSLFDNIYSFVETFSREKNGETSQVKAPPPRPAAPLIIFIQFTRLLLSLLPSMIEDLRDNE